MVFTWDRVRITSNAHLAMREGIPLHLNVKKYHLGAKWNFGMMDSSDLNRAKEFVNHNVKWEAWRRKDIKIVYDSTFDTFVVLTNSSIWEKRERGIFSRR